MLPALLMRTNTSHFRKKRNSPAVCANNRTARPAASLLPATSCVFGCAGLRQLVKGGTDKIDEAAAQEGMRGLPLRVGVE